MADKEDNIIKGCGIEVQPTTVNSRRLSTSLSGSNVSMSSLKRRNFWKPNYDLMWVKNKGAFIVLTWNFLTSSVLRYMIGGDGKLLLRKLSSTVISDYPTIILALSTVLYPIAGWLADVHIGRYKTIRASLWILWIGIVLYVVGRITAQLIKCDEIVSYFYLLVYLMLAIGLGGFQANIIQFGVDQLLDASAEQITTFVTWYVGTMFGGGVIVDFLNQYVPKGFRVLLPLLLAVNLSLALCVDFCFSSKHLVKEPVTQNPFKLVKNVIAYAIKNKHPRMRSAFTYCEDELPSRIDLAKVKYGGPFTTEQVEDVKTFFRILGAILLGTIVISAILITNVYIMDLMRKDTIFYKSEFSKGSPSLNTSYKIFSIDRLANFSATFWVLLYKLFVHPFFHRWMPQLSILNKLAIVLLLVLLNIIAVITLNQIGRYNAINTHHSSSNITLQCILDTKDSSKFALNISYYWFAIPEILFGLSMLVSVIGALEFICAQCPYSMKGLLLGTVYGMVGVMTLTEIAIIVIPFKLTAKYWKGSLFSCGFWILTIEGLSVMILLILFRFMSKRYKRRQREDVLPNEHVFANQYYSQLLRDTH